MLLMVASLLLLSAAGMVRVVCRMCGVDEKGESVWYVGVCILLLSFIAVYGLSCTQMAVK